mmetsp:Transcript_39771/g.114021  ORF Transcript_39771/g.114021 Transcript_39771/m.114021 type:complete len:319 (-) Transcript_39771:446-1402(-)
MALHRDGRHHRAGGHPGSQPTGHAFGAVGAVGSCVADSLVLRPPFRQPVAASRAAATDGRIHAAVGHCLRSALLPWCQRSLAARLGDEPRASTVANRGCQLDRGCRCGCAVKRRVHDPAPRWHLDGSNHTTTVEDRRLRPGLQHPAAALGAHLAVEAADRLAVAAVAENLHADREPGDELPGHRLRHGGGALILFKPGSEDFPLAPHPRCRRAPDDRRGIVARTGLGFTAEAKPGALPDKKSRTGAALHLGIRCPRPRRLATGFCVRRGAARLVQLRWRLRLRRAGALRPAERCIHTGGSSASSIGTGTGSAPRVAGD